MIQKTTCMNMITVILTIIVISNKKEVTDIFRSVIVQFILVQEIDKFSDFSYTSQASK
jgi:hypothetical protein